jgi:hypothetical protein
MIQNELYFGMYIAFPVVILKGVHSLDTKLSGAFANAI